MPPVFVPHGPVCGAERSRRRLQWTRRPPSAPRHAAGCRTVVSAGWRRSLAQPEGTRHRGAAVPRRLRLGRSPRSASSTSSSTSRARSSATSRSWTSSPTRSGRRCSTTRTSASCRCCPGHWSPLGVALLVAMPLGHRSIAIYLSRVRHAPRARDRRSRCSSCCRGVPTVVYGYFALLFVTPLLQMI